MRAPGWYGEFVVRAPDRYSVFSEWVRRRAVSRTWYWHHSVQLVGDADAAWFGCLADAEVVGPVPVEARRALATEAMTNQFRNQVFQTL